MSSSLIVQAPTRILTCSSASFNWTGGKGPYTLSFDPFKATEPRLVLADISSQEVTINLNYPTGTSIGWALVDDAVNSTTPATGNIDFDDSGHDTCLFQSTSSNNTALGNTPVLSWGVDSKGQPETAPPSPFSASACSPLTLSWTGGSGIYDVYLQSQLPGSTIEATWIFDVGSNNSLTTTLPFASGSQYVAVIGSSGSNSTIGSGNQTVGKGGNANCLLIGSSPSSSSSGSNHGALIGGVVGGILGLCLVAALVLFFRRKNQLARKAKRSNLKNAISDGQYKFQHSQAGEADAIPLGRV